MKINDELLEYLSKLSRLDIEESEKAKLKEDLSKILTWMEKLQEVNTDGVDPLVTMSREENQLRKDQVGEHLNREKVLQNAPLHDDKFIKVPKVKK